MYKLFFISLSFLWAYYAGFYFKENYQHIAGNAIGLIGNIISITFGVTIIICIGLFIAGIGYRITEHIDKNK